MHQYLYRYKQSKNFYFRIRLQSLGIITEKTMNSFFIRSLRTSDKIEAVRIASYIKSAILTKLTDYRVDATGSKKLKVGTNQLSFLKSHFAELLAEAYIKVEQNEEAVSLSQSQPLKHLMPEGTSAIKGKNTEKMITPTPQESYETSLFQSERSLLIEMMNRIKLLEKKIKEQSNTLKQLLMRSSETHYTTSYNEGLAKTEISDSHRAGTAYSLSAQFSIFKSELEHSAKRSTILSYQAKFKFLFSIISPAFDCRYFQKIHMQKVKIALLAKQKKGTNHEQKLSAKTVNHYLSHYRSFFAWLMKHIDGVTNNPFADVSVTNNTKREVRRAFTTDEVKRILSYEFKHRGEARTFRGDAKWFMKIALYSGMRLNEISGIRLIDVKEIDNIWCFDLRGRDTKNLASQRVVPIAEALLGLGLLEHMEMLKQKNVKYLFQQLRKGKKSPSKDGYGEPISRWFNRTVCTKIRNDSNEHQQFQPNIVFHSFRHTMIKVCIENGAQKHLIKRIVGHAQEDRITLGVYSNVQNISLSVLKAEIDRYLKF